MTTPDYQAAAGLLAGQLLAIDPSWLPRMRAYLSAAGPGTPKAGLFGERSSTHNSGPIGVVPIFGFMEQHESFLGWLFGGTSTTAVGQEVDRLAADPAVTSIVLWCNSPGGAVFGLGQAAASIRAARQKKTVVAVADSLCASAAYWLCSQAATIYAAPGALVGSIGVVAESSTEPLILKEQLGVTTTVVVAGQHKAAGHPSAPLSDAARADIQSMVDGFYGDFVRAVAIGRGQAEAVVRGERFGQGRVFKDTEALSRGLVDGVRSFSQVLVDLARPARTTGAMASAKARAVQVETALHIPPRGSDRERAARRAAQVSRD